MNRRSFLSGLGAALGTLALATRLAQDRLIVMVPPRSAMSTYLTDSSAWYIKTEPGQLKTFIRLPRHIDGWHVWGTTDSRV